MRPWPEGHRESLLLWIADGKFLMDWIRANPGCLDRSTINDRVNNNTDGFGDQYREARLLGATAIAEDAVRIIDKEPGRLLATGGYDSAEVAWAKNRAYFRMEALKKWFPQQYGDKLELAGNLTHRHAKEMTDAELAAIAAGSGTGTADPPQSKD